MHFACVNAFPAVNSHHMTLMPLINSAKFAAEFSAGFALDVCKEKTGGVDHRACFENDSYISMGIFGDPDDSWFKNSESAADNFQGLL